MATRTNAVSATTRRRIEQGMPDLVRAATTQMEENHPWYRALSAEDRGWG